MALYIAVVAITTAASPVWAQRNAESEVRAAVDRYNAAFIGKDLPALKALLAKDIVLYEHSVQNIGLDDVWDNHLERCQKGVKSAVGFLVDNHKSLHLSSVICLDRCA